MNNIKYEIKGNKLLLEIDVGESNIADAPRSKKGNKLVASTGGWLGIPAKLKKGSIALNLNLVHK